MAEEDIVKAVQSPCVPIAYGTIAFQIGKNRIGSATEHSHKWMVYVRGAMNQDISYAISKVVFTLHPSFDVPVREISTPPYQVSETGWGSFEIGIRIHLHDSSVPPINIVHILKLFPDTGGAQAMGPDKPTLSEVYDELVFNELPSDPIFRTALLRGPVNDPPVYPYQEHLGIFSSENDLAIIKATRTWVRERMEEQEDRLVQRKAEAAALKKQLVSLGLL